MKPLLALLPLVTLTACLNSTVRGYSAVPAAGLTSAFTEHCTALRLLIDGREFVVDHSDRIQLFTSAPNPGATSITAQCLVGSLGEYVVTGQSTVRVDANTLNVAIGSSEGSTEAAAFARTATVRGMFPIIRTP